MWPCGRLVTGWSHSPERVPIHLCSSMFTGSNPALGQQ